ncbi:hypothetical protein B0T18DRAFT_320640 [Schizothecium vesticola]|uniref:Zn(2)-C6 fungal-type domain-containing protein n=1 Tax=Schizothecium vesticola TaxID=314040 RepID=A0AA40KAW7_9PEZI|nr:hypothetical protein B0T18DRAFT_320640 [Schizothecium vesticola]
MAGPGGGPPRRSHTKSRKGCETCKKRHIRCDETFPQCRNCTKHKQCCPYNDLPVTDDRAGTPDKPDLMWTPDIEATIEQWQRTGVFPFPSLDIYPTPDPRALTTDQLRLIHHVAAISHHMNEIGANGFTLWTRQIPKIIQISATYDYVLHALLGFSAMHLAFLTDCPLVGNMGYEHRGIALKGLHEAITNFSKENSDAILAASLVLSWQATEWRSWTHLMKGTSAVIDEMEAWKHESQFGDFIAESDTFPTAPPSPTPDHKPSQPREEDLEAFEGTLQQLQKVESYLKQRREDTKHIAQLISFLKGARKVSPTLSVSQQFERLRPLRTWLFYLPVMSLEQTHGSPSSLLIIAHYYTAALVMERLFPEIGAAYFGSMTIRPVEDIARRLYAMNQSPEHKGDLDTAVALMRYPLDTLDEFRFRMGWNQPVRTPSFPQYSTPTIYMNEPFITSTTPPNFMPYGDNANLAFNFSTEDLSLLIPDSAPNSAISPMQPSFSSFPSPYLGVPSPFLGGYSPATSSFGGDFGDGSSIVYSDTEENASFDVGLSASSSRHHSFGFGFVPPIQVGWM